MKQAGVEVSLFKRPQGVRNDTIRDGMQCILELLSDSGVTGRFACHPYRQMKFKGNLRLRLGIYNNERFVTLKVKPGNNGTAWEWYIYPPDSIAASALFTALQERLSPDEDLPLSAATATSPEALPVVVSPLPEPADVAKSPSITLPPLEPALTAETTGVSLHDLNLHDLVTALTSAVQRKTLYQERQELLGQLQLSRETTKRALEEAELLLLTAQEAHAQVQTDYEALRSEHLSDTEGKVAVELLTNFKALVG